jgi:prepilin-type N-terminal cleavage/methylation domain-containing protein
MKKRMSQTDKYPSRTGRIKAGFTLAELVIVVAIICILAAIAVPNMLNMVHTAKLRGAGSDFSGVLQLGRIRAVQDNRYYSTYIVAGPPQEAYVDLTGNGGTGVVAGDPLIEIPPEVTPIAAANAPNTPSLQGHFLPTFSVLAVFHAPLKQLLVGPFAIASAGRPPFGFSSRTPTPVCGKPSP